MHIIGFGMAGIRHAAAPAGAAAGTGAPAFFSLPYSRNNDCQEYRRDNRGNKECCKIHKKFLL